MSDEEIEETEAINDFEDFSQPHQHTMSMLYSVCTKINQWMIERNTRMTLNFEMIPKISVVCTCYDVNGAIEYRHYICEFDPHIDYSEYSTQSMIRHIFKNIIQTKNEKLITRLLKPPTVRYQNSSQTPSFVPKQHHLGIYYTNGVPLSWYMSIHTGNLFVYRPETGITNMVAEFNPVDLMIGENSIKTSVTFLDSLYCDALKIIRTKEYIEKISVM